MPITIEPAWESPSYKGKNGVTIDVVYLIFGTSDDEEAYTALISETAIQAYAGCPAVAWELNERRTEDLFVGRITYEVLIEEGDYEYSFTTKGGTAKITQALATVGSYASSGSPPSIGNVIGITKDGVEGCDIVVPTFSWTETHRVPATSVTEGYKIGLANITGTVNSDSFRGFAAGEVRFDGVDGRRTSPDEYSIDFTFSASPNATGLTVGTMTGIAKKGWEYLWVLYAEDTSNNRLIKKPVACYVNQVYRYVAFSGLGL